MSKSLTSLLAFSLFHKLLSYSYPCNSKKFSFSNSYGSREVISNIKKTETPLPPKSFSCLRVRYKGTFIRLMALNAKHTLNNRLPCIWKPFIIVRTVFTISAVFLHMLHGPQVFDGLYQEFSSGPKSL